MVMGLVVVGMAAILGVFIEAQRHAGGPPEEVPRSIAIPALYATAGIIAIVAAIQRRPLIVMAAALTCLLASLLSIATLAFVIPAITLLALAARSVPATRDRRDGIVAAGVGVMIIGAWVALLATTGGRCWQETGTIANPIYAVTACDEGAASSNGSQGTVGGSAGGVQIIGSGYDSGVLTLTGATAEAVLLAGALVLVVVTGLRATGPGQPAKR